MTKHITSTLGYANPTHVPRTKFDWLYVMGWISIGFVTMLGLIGIALK